MSAKTGLRIFLIFATGYFLSYVYRGLNIGFAPFLTAELGLSAGDMGLLTSAYFMSFALAQLPAGLALDTYGARKTEACLLLVAALGTVVYGMSSGMIGLFMGRFLIGMGVSVCLGAAFMALAQNFPMSRLPMLNGVMVALGGMGGVVVGTPLAALLQHYSWQAISIGMAVCTLLMAALMWFGVVDPKSQRARAKISFSQQMAGTRRILSHRVFWQLASLPSVCGGAFYAAQSLWVRPYMIQAQGMLPEQADRLVSLLGLMLVAGTVITGLLARKLERLGLNLFRFAGLGMLAFLFVQLGVIMQWPIPYVLLWSVYGFSASCSILAYSVMAEAFPHQVVGRVTTAFNMVYFVCIFSMQMGIGYILDVWPQQDGVYPAQAHITAWGIMLGLQLLAALWYFWPSKLKVEAAEFV
ncbi:MFS transporter [Advenella faeciporci]|uniref:MFS transporter n=1 Tax=Advenella faeciporci TaxID=797535 RepID=A0A918JRI0_9BURK|nr:MFS transporter [Advenella faeciporci]GGW95794.1 MFS transporter [Advenella faeciporci]